MFKLETFLKEALPPASDDKQWLENATEGAAPFHFPPGTLQLHTRLLRDARYREAVADVSTDARKVIHAGLLTRSAIRRIGVHQHQKSPRPMPAPSSAASQIETLHVP